ncbi:pogo transposable element with KRAB domain-like protein [Aphelenchoides avenae]|nr:pogo transposable element with KRAB domain-like protein [Aphelenchus avenae]
MPFGPNARCKKEVEKKFVNKLHLIWMDTTWMNNPITAIYSKKLFGGLLAHFKPKRFPVWDQFSAHKSTDSQAMLKQLKVETVLIPAGCTRFVQHADGNDSDVSVITAENQAAEESEEFEEEEDSDSEF